MKKFETTEEKIEYDQRRRTPIAMQERNAVGTSSMFIPDFGRRFRTSTPQITIQPKINPKGAVKWKGEIEAYYINNVLFNKHLWEALVDKRIVSLKGILGLRNIEQRMSALSFMGIEWLLKESNAKLIDKSKRGNELYMIAEIFQEPAYFLKYKDISTDRVYFSGIDPAIFRRTIGNAITTIFKKGDMADKAMAWKFQIELKEYNQLKIES